MIRSRKYIDSILYWLNKGKVVVMYGARQVGKTTILELINAEISKMKILSCENISVANALSSNDENQIKLLFGEAEIIALDEAQKIENIGSILKYIYDNKDLDYKLIATGSSSFELSNKITEPLTGRNVKIRIYPYSLSELVENMSGQWVLENLNTLLVYGSYPEIVEAEMGDKEVLLSNLASDYLYQDILQHERLQNASVLLKLLKALALQLGSEVSYNEVGNLLGITSKTVERYIDLLEKNFVLIQVDSYSRNLRNELKKSKKIYFVDVGLRNGLLSSFSSIDLRTDKGPLWENFCVLERMKTNSIKERKRNLYFWRTYDQAEIDLIEEYDDAMDIYEFKYSSKKSKVKFPKSFMNAYPVRNKFVVTSDKWTSLME